MDGKEGGGEEGETWLVGQGFVGWTNPIQGTDFMYSLLLDSYGGFPMYYKHCALQRHVGVTSLMPRPKYVHRCWWITSLLSTVQHMSLGTSLGFYTNPTSPSTENMASLH